MNYKSNQEQDYDVLIWDKSIQIMKDITSLMELMKQRKMQYIKNESLMQGTDAIQKAQSKDRLIPVTKWNDYYDYLTINGLRQLIFRSNQNGFKKVIRRIRGRVLIKEDEFFKWVEVAKITIPALVKIGVIFLYYNYFSEVRVLLRMSHSFFLSSHL